MNPFVAVLSPRQLGADVLVHLALAQASGTLTFGPLNKTRQLMFAAGRPQRGVAADGHINDARAFVRGMTQQFACVATGTCTFSQGNIDQNLVPEIDTLDEVLLAVMTQLTAVHLDAVVAARGKHLLVTTASFGTFAAAITGCHGARVQPPADGITLDDLLQGTDGKVRRALCAQVLLGGLKPTGWRLRLQDNGATQRSPGQDIDQAYDIMPDLDHYALLSLPHDCSASDVRQAFTLQSRKWHADTHVGHPLTDTQTQKLQALCARAEEAQRVLTHSDERKQYDWSLARVHAGLPTDPKVIQEAEGLFRRAEAFVKKGQATAAEPVLLQAVQMNPGEANFWAYLGHAVHAAHGLRKADKAHAHLKKALELQPDNVAAHAFLGGLLQAEGRIAEAREHLSSALQYDPENIDAQRYTRLLQMRQEQGAAPQGGILTRFFKK